MIWHLFDPRYKFLWRAWRRRLVACIWAAIWFHPLGWLSDTAIRVGRRYYRKHDREMSQAGWDLMQAGHRLLGARWNAVSRAEQARREFGREVVRLMN